MFSIAQLLVPVSAADVCGADISFSSEVDEIVRARMQDDPALEQGAWVAALKEADWGFVAARCAALIESRSKDLRLAVWLAEAHARTRQFRGLGDGYALLAGLCERYWDGLHPQADDDGAYEQRTGNLYWLLARTPQLVRGMPLTEQGAVCMADFGAARQRMMAAATQDGNWGAAPSAEPAPGLAELDAARRGNTPQFNDNLLADANYCLASLAELERVVDAKLGADGPGFGAARSALLDAIDFIAPLATPVATAGVGEGRAGGTSADKAATAAKGARAAAGGPPQTRAQALTQLRQVADYFRRTEPHSPVAYLADKAALWGEMPLHVWLRSVLREPSALAQVEELLGTGGQGGGA